MLFSSIEFLFLFLPVVWVAVQLSPSQSRLGVLLVASLVFYGWWDWRFLPLMLLSIGVNFLIGQALARENRQLLLAVGIAFNLALLGIFKYLDFGIEITNTLMGTQWRYLGLLLPLGISFFTFQQIAYLVDTNRGLTAQHRPSLGRYALFVTFFPQLIAGPIVHHREMLPQLLELEGNGWSVKQRHLAQGLVLLCLGLFKKLVIADRLIPWIDPVFSNPAQAEFYSAWVATLSYTMQLYFDFSAYSDMALGIALLFGIKLPLNFNSPYKSASIQEFWRRWHITLGRFLRDYLYIPLGGSRHGLVRAMLALVVTMLLGGLWHGAGWQFIVWGGLHGLMLVIFLAWRQQPYRLPRGAAITITFLCVVLAWVPFRAESLADAADIWAAMFGLHGVVVPPLWGNIIPGLANGGSSIFSFRGHEALVIAVLVIAVLELRNAYEISRTIRPTVRCWARPAVAGLAAVYFIGAPSTFLYFNF